MACSSTLACYIILNAGILLCDEVLRNVSCFEKVNAMLGMHTHMHAHTHMHTHTHACTHTHMLAHTHTHTNNLSQPEAKGGVVTMKGSYVCVCMRVCVCVCACVCVCYNDKCCHAT